MTKSSELLARLQMEAAHNAQVLTTLLMELRALREQVAALTAELRARKERVRKRRRTIHQRTVAEIMAGPNPPTEVDIARARKLLR